MTFSFDELKSLRKEGFTDDQIASVLSSNDKSIGDVFKEGYTLDQITSTISGQPIPEPEPIEERGIARAAGDVGVAFLQGGVGGFRALTDVFGADNPASTALRGVEEDVGNLLSAQAKEDKNEVSRILTEAQDKGIYDQLVAGVEAFATAPVLTTAGAAGSIAVNLLGGITANAASLGIRGVALGAKGLMASQAAVGAAQGAGTIKGQIYDATESYLLEKGMSPEIAKQGASEAQSYGGKNLDSILLGTGLGAANALTGVEKIAGKVILKQGGVPTKSAVRRFITGTAGEMVPEAVQAGQEQVAQNLALQREGADVPTMRGVASAAALEGLAGGALGGPTSLFFDRPRGETPQVAEEREIDSTSDQVADELEKEPTSPATEMAMRRMQSQTQIDNLKTEIEEDELTLQSIEQTSPDRQRAELALSGKKTALANLVSEFNTIPKEELSETITPAAAPATPTATKETTIAKIDELNKEFDALDENDQAGIDRVNEAIAVEQNKLAGLTAIEQGVEPQGTTPTREMGLPPSGRRSEFGTFFPDRPVLQAFVKATDKVLGGIKATGKRAQKLKNAIRTGIAANAGFLAGTNTEVISSEEYGKLTGGKQVAADTGTYRATFLNGKKYLVVPDVNVLQQLATQGEQRAASRDAALDQESRAAAKKLEEEMIHLSMFQGIQDEYKALKNPKLTEQEYIVRRISDIAQEVKRTNPNALPGVSEVYLNEKNKNLDDLTFSQEFMRMVIQRVRTGQITEDLNAIRKAEQETFSDQDKGIITAWKNSLLNALQFLRNSITRYLGKGTSTKEVKKMEDTINSILDGYGIVKGEANYEFKDYSKAEPTVKESLTVQPALPDRTISDAIKDKDTFVFEGMRGAISLEDGTVVFREFGTNNKYQVPVNPNQNISEISGIEWVRKGQTRNIPAEPTTEVAAIIESDPQISEEEVNAEQDDFQVPQALVEIEKSQVLNYIAEVLNTGESKIVKDGKRKQKVSQTPEFYSQITPKQIELANRQIDTALRIIDGLPISDEQKQSLAEPYLLIDQDITSYESNPEYKQIKASKRREVFPTDQAVALTETGGQVEAVSETITPAIEAKAGVTPQQIAAAEKSTVSKTALELIRGNYGELSDMINKIIDSNPKIADALQKIPVELTSRNSFDGETVRIDKKLSGPKLVETINHEIVHSFLAVALREVPSFRDAINSIRNDAIERAKYSNDASFRYALTLIRDARGLSNGPIYPIKKTENLSQYMVRNSDNLLKLWKMGRDNPVMSYEIFETAYALASNDEFLAHLMSDKRFRDELKSYKVFTPDNRNLLQKFIDAIRGLFQKVTRVEKTVLDKAMEQVERVVQLPEYNPRPIEGLAEMLAKSESGIIARAGVTPEGEPMSKKSQTVMQKITTRMISDLEAQAEMLKPKNNKAYTEYQSRAAQKDKKWNKALLSPFSIAANLFTSNSFTAANNALDKIFRNNPDADFFSVAQNLAGMDEATAQRAYNISPYERLVLMDMMYELSSVYRKQVLDSNMSASAREAFALESINVEAGLARNIALTLRESGRMVQAAAALRKLVGAGMAIDTYKRNIIASMGNLSAVTRSSFNEVANAIRGDRRKSMDKVFNTQSVFRKAASLIKMAQRNPEKVRQSIRAEVSKKQTDSTRQILLDFAAGLFDTKEDKYANMVVDQTVQNILSIGMNKKEFSIDNVTKFMYQSFAAAAKQMGIQQAGIEKQKAGKRSGKYLEMVKAVIGNDNAYKAFLNDLANRMAEKYQSRDAFNADFAELFKALRSNEWADKLRTQAVKDSADFLNYKFNDLFTYLGSQRNVNQEAVKQHIRTELQGTGASNELIEKFIQDTDKYLNDETSRILQDKLGFRIDEKTGKVMPKPLMSAKIQEEAEAQFKAIKNLKDISKLSTSDEGNFKQNLISRIITEVGMDEQNATELATLISAQMEKAMLAQRSENVDKAIKKAQEVLANNKIKSTANQRTILQKLIEMANMGVLDSEMVYEAFRQTHDFPKGFMPYDAEFANTIREWGDRISKLPAGVIRSIEEEKMGRALMNKSKFTTGDILSSYWYFSLISQVSTSAINALSGGFNLMFNVATWASYNPKTIIPMMRALYSAVSGKQSPAVNSFLYVMRNGLNPSGMQDEKRAKYPKTNVLEGATPENVPKIVYYLTNFGDGKINFLPDWMNTALKNVNPRQLMRILRATDMFLREAAYEAKAAQLGAADFTREGFDMAKRQAELELASSQATGKQKDQEIIIRANEIYREQRLKDEEKRAIAEQASLETAFNQDPQGLFGMLANFVNGLLAKYPATKFVIPFTNVVANVTNEFLNYTPIFSQYRLIRAKQSGMKDPFTQGRADKEHEIAIKGMIGIAAMLAPFIIQALTGGDEEDQEKRPYIQFYAEGPKDPRQKKIWQQRGGQKYSVRVGDTYYSYLYTPLVIPLASGAMLQEEIKSMKKKGEKVQVEDIGKLAASAITAPFSIGFVAVLNQSFLTGLADLLEFKESQNPVEKGTQFVGGIISRMLVPGAFRDINKLYTEDKAVGGDYLSNFFKDMPGSVNFLNKDVNYFGDDAKFPSAVQESGFGRRLASVVGRIVSTEQPDPAWDVLYRNNLTPPAWDSSLSWDNGKKMTKEQELQFIREAGPMMRDAIIDIQGDLDELPLDEAQDLLSTEIRIIRREVKEDLQDRLEIPLDIE